MNRRDFVRLAGSGISATALAETIVDAQVARSPAPVRPSPPLKMHVGTQQGDSEEMLRAFAAFGVNHICGSLPSKKLDDAWTVEALSARYVPTGRNGVIGDLFRNLGFESVTARGEPGAEYGRLPVSRYVPRKTFIRRGSGQ